MKPAPAGHAAQGKQLQLAHLAAQTGRRLEPVHLAFLAQFIGLGHKDFPANESSLEFPPPYILSHGGLSHLVVGPLLPEPDPNSMGRMALLASG
jgi:hypothetical protein